MIILHQTEVLKFAIKVLAFVTCSDSQKLVVDQGRFGPAGCRCSTPAGLGVACSAPSAQSFSTTLTLPAFSSWVPMATPVGSYRSSVYPSVSL